MSLTDKAIAQIRELIRTGALPPGSSCLRSRSWPPSWARPATSPARR